MKCNKCQNELRVVPEEIGKDANGAPIFHSIGYCDTCMTKTDLTVINYQNVAATNHTQQNTTKKRHSGLSAANAFLAIFLITIPIGFILSIVDLCTDKERKYKHGGSIFCLFFGILAAIAFYGKISTGGNDTTKKVENDTSFVTITNPVEETENIEYIKATADDLKAALNDNPLNASNTYKGQYIELTGKLNVIDSSGEYISVYSINEEWDFTGIKCSLNKEHLEKVSTLKIGDTITVRVKITDVGEILGYSSKLIEFVD